MSSYFIETPFDNFLIFDIERKLINKIVFSHRKDGAALSGGLKSLLEGVFDKRDLSLFDYSLINFDKTRKSYALYKFLIGTKTGETHSYSQAGKIVFGDVRYARAVAKMLNANPFTFLVPCHRIVAKNGIGGYAEGVKLKLTILHWEGAEKGMEVNL